MCYFLFQVKNKIHKKRKMSQVKKIFIGRPLIKEAYDIIKNAGYETSFFFN